MYCTGLPQNSNKQLGRAEWSIEQRQPLRIIDWDEAAGQMVENQEGAVLDDDQQGSIMNTKTGTGRGLYLHSAILAPGQLEQTPALGLAADKGREKDKAAGGISTGNRARPTPIVRAEAVYQRVRQAAGQQGTFLYPIEPYSVLSETFQKMGWKPVIRHIGWRTDHVLDLWDAREGRSPTLQDWNPEQHVVRPIRIERSAQTELQQRLHNAYQRHREQYQAAKHNHDLELIGICRELHDLIESCFAGEPLARSCPATDIVELFELRKTAVNDAEQTSIVRTLNEEGFGCSYSRIERSVAGILLQEGGTAAEILTQVAAVYNEN